MKIYTSYFGNVKKLRTAGLVTIGIARWKPRFYEGLCMFSVAPTPYMLSDNCEHEEYIALYNDILQKRGAKSIVEEIEKLSYGKDVALLCYESPEKFCHRHLLADFLNKELNLGVEEFGLSEKKEDIQASLF
ncbi:MAG: DUF488 family protein [Bacteroidales bacterium]|nr:DUF488 family protein [Bacteroidales bacterium]